MPPRPITPLPNMISGLMCAHPNCFALFSNLDDSETHAFEAHAGKVLAVTCAVSEHQLENGDVQLLRVLDEIDPSGNESGENSLPTPVSHQLGANGEKSTGIRNPDAQEPLLRVFDELDESGNESGENSLPTPISHQLGENGEKSTGIGNPDAQEPPDCGPTQLDAGFVPASMLLLSTPTPSQAANPSSLVPVSYSGQSLSQNSTQSLSRHSTLSATLSLSSFSPESGEDLKLDKILTMVQDVTTEPCRICWVDKTRTHPHPTFRCVTGICSGTEWKSFKKDLRFPRGKVCFFCMAPYGPPFNHAQPSPGEQRSPNHCDYPDVLKELAYILYARQPLREQIFAHLGVSTPLTLEVYKKYIAKRQNGGLFGAYNVIYAYLEIREEEVLAQ